MMEYKESPVEREAVARDQLCLLIEDQCPRIDPFTHLPLGHQVEALADAILSMIRPAPTSEGESVAVREALEAARDGLVREAIHMEQDYPGDGPVDCGWWCRLCQDHVDGDRRTGPSTDGHETHCPIAKIEAALRTQDTSVEDESTVQDQSSGK